MLFILVKYAITAAIIVIISEVAKRSDRLGALIASLPFVTILAMIWLFFEKSSTEKIANHAYYTFWYVLPTLPMFLLMPWMLNKGIHFWICLGVSSLQTILLFALTGLALKRFGISLF